MQKVTNSTLRSLIDEYPRIVKKEDGFWLMGVDFALHLDLNPKATIVGENVRKVAYLVLPESQLPGGVR